MVEDTVPDMALVNHALRKAGLNFRSRRVDSRESFLHELEHHLPDVILSDHGVPGFDGFAALAEARHRCPEVPFIFVTGAPGEEAAEETLKSGADDYILKNHLHLLAPAIERALRDADTRLRHRRLETALHEAEEHLRLLAAEVRDYAAFMLDAEGRVASWNPAAEQILGYEPNEILGQDAETIFGPDRDPFETAAASGRAEAACDCRHRNGERRRTNLVVVPLRGALGRTRGFLCLLRDLSHRAGETGSAGHEAREQAAQWESAHREMEQFTHAIALDLRAPLRHIESFTELLNKSAGDALDQKSRGYLKVIADSAHHISRLVDDLFTYSRIGNAEIHRLHLSLSEVVKEIIHDLRHETEGRRVEWIIGDLPEVIGDPVLLWMVLTNLIANALKFTRTRAEARIEIGSTATESEVVIFIRDNGVGFDSQCAGRLFGVFQRLHAKEFEGTGVGLANARRIIQRHGGRTWAEGTENEGAVFYFSLPRGG